LSELLRTLSGGLAVTHTRFLLMDKACSFLLLMRVKAKERAQEDSGLALLPLVKTTESEKEKSRAAVGGSLQPAISGLAAFPFSEAAHSSHVDVGNVELFK
jgi:hypothetical protein